MKKMWAIRVVWNHEQHMGKDNIKLFDTRKDARIAKKNMKSLVGTVEHVSIHRWIEFSEGTCMLSRNVYY